MKKYLILMAGAMLTAISVLQVKTGKNAEEKLSQLALDNIEALAEDENPPNQNVFCFGTGTVNCYGYMVEQILYYEP
ncbi:MAG: NVEALA domain-containing protein [Tannerella sp.]|jgi:hypothetical protein|nr:NVEALA domain-containing protein [Tannerella sp.]